MHTHQAELNLYKQAFEDMEHDLHSEIQKLKMKQKPGRHENC
jgi:hypothetical protein